MPLDAARLRDSELASNEMPESCWAAVLLWCASWQQVPAASVPDDDMWLAAQTRYVVRGKIDSAWSDVRSGALRGWVKCADGRLYHPVVAEKALEAWLSKLLSTVAGATGNAKRWGIEVDTDAVKRQIVDAARRLEAVAPRSEWLKKSQVRAILKESPPDPGAIGFPSDGEPPPDGDGIAPRSEADRPPVANELKRNEVNTIGSSGGVGTLIRGGPVDNFASPPPGDDESDIPSDDEPLPDEAEIAQVLSLWEAKRGKRVAFGGEKCLCVFRSWRERDVTLGQLREAYRRALARRDADQDSTPINAAFLDRFIEEVRAPPREVPLPLGSMSNDQLMVEAKRFGYVLPPGMERPQAIAKIAQMRAETPGGHAS
ncbi:hypothetical protein OKW30_001400 [Paraburkholderia sp. Clong3]|uniref:hypothetical protein n=1 Tax=Paraburkholderia sp. Clong3 TaxID=2991061 RepID=UPI003D1C6A7F